MLGKILKRIWRKIKALVTGVFWYCGDVVRYKRLLKQSGQTSFFKYFPLVFDKDPASHTFDKHYVYMDAWAFKHILEKKPSEHVDVGSSIRFLSMATTVTKVKFVDIRPIKTDFKNFECVEGSILSLPFADNSVDSLSCLHVAEHIGLGRYGDPLDPEGTKKAALELARALKPGGRLYFALPIGKTTTYFNAHRVHSPKLILDYFKDLKLVSFAAVGDDGHFVKEAKPENYETATYACGCFEFTK
jgi:SAM-dependent methyltransferase